MDLLDNRDGSFRVLPPPSFRRSQSVTAVANLQKELESEEHPGTDGESGMLERCSSLPYLKLKGPMMGEGLNGPSNDGDNISVTSAGKMSEDRVQEMESDLGDARDAIVNLERTVSELQSRIVNLTSQLNQERAKNQEVNEELRVSRKLFLELNDANPRVQDNPTVRKNHDHLRSSAHSICTSVKEIGVQAISDEISVNGAKVLTSSTHSSSALSNPDQQQQQITTEVESSRNRLHDQPSDGPNDKERNFRSRETSSRFLTHFDEDLEEEVEWLHQQHREKEFQIQKLTEKLSKYFHRNAELEAEQMSTHENLEIAKNKLICRDQQVEHMKDIIFHQQEDIAVLEHIKEDLRSKCSDLEEKLEDLEDIVASLTQDVTGMAQEKKKLNRHIRKLNSSMENKEIEINDKLGELEAKSNLLEVIKKIAYSTPPTASNASTPRSVTGTPMNSPVGQPPQERKIVTGRRRRLSTDHSKQSHMTTKCDGKNRVKSKGDRQSPVISSSKDEQNQKMPTQIEQCCKMPEDNATFLVTPKEKSSHKMPSKQQRQASRSLKFPAQEEDKISGYYGNSDSRRSYCSTNDRSEDRLQPVNGICSQGTVSSLEDMTTKNPIHLQVAESDISSSRISVDSSLPEEQFQCDFNGNQSTPRDTADQGTDELIAQVLAELSEEEMCEADMQGSCDARMESARVEGQKTSMESEGLLLRKHELENYAIRARDRSWQYVYVVQHGHQLWFYESKEHHQLGSTYYGEGPVDVTDALVHVASDYSKRRHVFRVQLPNGQRFLFQARDDREMLFWVCSIDSSTRHRHHYRGIEGGAATETFNGAMPGIGNIPPPIMGSPSKTDRLRNRIKGSLSALTK